MFLSLHSDNINDKMALHDTCSLILAVDSFSLTNIAVPDKCVVFLLRTHHSQRCGANTRKTYLTD